MHGNLEGYVTWCAWAILYQIYVDTLAYNFSDLIHDSVFNFAHNRQMLLVLIIYLWKNQTVW